ncbi:hypothetical protein [Actinopolymorpha pittospori]|uniref:DUF5666 domain-containing protein n=1 Tax=Actinopolymorpha pittospori TaxID=648752 RepID=A0A927RDE4_9ACTN|nr:hypothetical protein [Actinopolymorpha pittospori]MBE1608055.1 hypothetical protein [Actinopolymorpha pittospori]
MDDYDPASLHETSATSGSPVAESSSGMGAAQLLPPASLPDSSVSVATVKQARWEGERRSLLIRKGRWPAAVALMCAVVGLSGCAATPSSAAATPPSATAAALSAEARDGMPGSGGDLGSGGGGSEARFGPAAGGSSGTVSNVSTSSFTMSTATGQKVTVKETSTTTYRNGASSTSASAMTTGEPVVVLGTVDNTTITATQVIVQATAGGSTTSSQRQVIPFQQGAPTTSKQVGQVPANYSEGSGTIVSGAAANKATEAALGAYSGGVVDRVVKLSNGEYEVHNIGVNWPHHIFVNQGFKVIGAE